MLVTNVYTAVHLPDK